MDLLVAYVSLYWNVAKCFLCAMASANEHDDYDYFHYYFFMIIIVSYDIRLRRRNKLSSCQTLAVERVLSCTAAFLILHLNDCTSSSSSVVMARSHSALRSAT